jgi:hypothetical protein
MKEGELVAGRPRTIAPRSSTILRRIEVHEALRAADRRQQSRIGGGAERALKLQAFVGSMCTVSGESGLIGQQVEMLLAEAVQPAPGRQRRVGRSSQAVQFAGHLLSRQARPT